MAIEYIGKVNRPAPRFQAVLCGLYLVTCDVFLSYGESSDIPARILIRTTDFVHFGELHSATRWTYELTEEGLVQTNGCWKQLPKDLVTKIENHDLVFAAILKKVEAWMTKVNTPHELI